MAEPNCSVDFHDCKTIELLISWLLYKVYWSDEVEEFRSNLLIISNLVIIKLIKMQL